jgi:hypothetical protein
VGDTYHGRRARLDATSAKEWQPSAWFNALQALLPPVQVLASEAHHQQCDRSHDVRPESSVEEHEERGSYRGTASHGGSVNRGRVNTTA